MSPDRRKLLRAHIAYQRGAGLPMAIFLITVMVLIVATIVQIQESSGEMEALDVLSTRAFYAAESGAQAGLSQALQNEPASCGGVTVSNIEFTEAGLQGCESFVDCDDDSATAGDAVVITSEGICGSGNSEAVRVVEVKAQ